MVMEMDKEANWEQTMEWFKKGDKNGDGEL